MAQPTPITMQGIGPEASPKYFITMGLDIAAAALAITVIVPGVVGAIGSITVTNPGLTGSGSVTVSVPGVTPGSSGITVIVPGL